MKLLIVVALVFFSHRALAHALDLGLLRADVESRQIIFALELAPEAAAQVSGLALTDLTNDHVAHYQDVLFAATLGASSVGTDGGKICAWAPSIKATLNDEKILISGTADCSQELKAWSLALPFLRRAPANFELLVKLKVGAETSELIARADDPKIEFYPQARHSWGQFIAMGIKHIGAFPSEWKDESGIHLPEGIDHILFVVALVLGGGGLIELLKTVTGFTIGHSVTLALATLGWIHVPSRLVESGIALSIAIVAAEGIFAKKSKSRWKIALAFGLLHGLGFASALTVLHLNGISFVRALIGFNFGVEAGQAIIVLLTLPFFYLCNRQKFSQAYVLPAFSGGIFLIGVYWFVARAFNV